MGFDLCSIDRRRLRVNKKELGGFSKNFFLKIKRLLFLD